MKTSAQDNLTGENLKGRFANTPLRILTASSIIGDKVYNRQHEKMGDIKDIMLDLKGGCIEYLIIEFGGWLGMGEKYFAIPFRMVTVDSARGVFILNLEREVLERAPGFDKDHWPDTNSHSFQSLLHSGSDLSETI